jgi:hypothetical protein
LKVFNVKGQQVMTSRVEATGFVQKATLDFRGTSFATGLYLVVAEGSSPHSFTVLRR